MKKKTEVIDLKEFKRGMLGVLKVLAQESLEAQRLDHYSLYKTMQEIVEKANVTISPGSDLESIQDDEERIARMLLNFLKDKKN